MSLLFVDGATHYDTADALKKWGGFDGGLSISASSPRRTGTKSIYANSNVWSARTQPFDAARTFLVGAGAFRMEYGTSISFLIGPSTAQLTLVYWSNQHLLEIRRGTYGGTLLASINTEGLIVPSEWYYLEFAATISDTAGTTEVRLNGVTLAGLSLSGVDTKAATEAGSDRVAFYPGGGGYMTDLYVDDAVFHGDCIVETLYPTGNGSHHAWSPSAGQNWENVDDPGDIDEDTTYNSSGQQGAKDTFLHAPVPSRPDSVIKAVAVHFTARKDWAGTRVVKPMLRYATTDYVHAGDGLILSDIYHGQQRLWETNPSGGGAWTESTVNTVEIGYDLVTAT